MHSVTLTWGSLGLRQGPCPTPSLHKRPNIWETNQIPTYKPYIFLFLMIRCIQWHQPGGHSGCAGAMPNPLHFIKGLISQKPFRSPPLNHIYTCSLWLDTFSDTNLGVPGVEPGPCPTPPLHKRPYISETVQIPTPKPYLYLFFMIRHIQWHQPGGPGDGLGPCPIPPLHKRPYISETALIPTSKPYFFLFLMIRCIQWHQPGGPCGAQGPCLLLTLPFHFYKVEVPTGICKLLKTILWLENAFIFWWPIEMETKSTWELIWVLGVCLGDYILLVLWFQRGLCLNN